ncbi:MAG: response regulator [Patescibacteria group bacterium]
MSTPVVVIADDEKDLREMIAFRIRRWGYADVRQAANGFEAIALVLPLLNEGKRVILVTDNDMGKPSGEEVVRVLADKENLAIIMNAGKKPEDKAVLSKLIKFIAKPDLDEVLPVALKEAWATLSEA